MPKSPTAPPDPVARMTDVAMRKKKNADAQAAFRARRANYIATLEASVTNLESVVLEVQDSIRRVEHERDSLRFQIQEHAKYCKMPSASSPFSDNSHCGTSSHSTPHLHSFNNLHYQDDSHGTPASSHGPDYTSSSFQRNDLTPDAAGPSSHLHRAGGKYGAQYPYAMTESSRDMRNGWQVPMLNPTLHRGDAVMGGHHSQSPVYMNSPSITSVNDQVPELSGRICVEDSKARLGQTQDGGPCVFSDDDLYHPSVGSGHPSRSSTSSAMHPSAPPQMTSSLTPMPFSDQPQDGAGGFTYRHSTQLIHQGDSLLGQSTDNTRYRISGRETNTEHHSMLTSSNEANIQDLNDEDDFDEDNLRVKNHRNTTPSRSSSPARPSISCTVAVIRAQSFGGALRRTRASTKKSTEAARITLDVLQSRGIGLRDSDMAAKQSLVADGGHHNMNTS